MVAEELAVLIVVAENPGIDRASLSLEARRLLERPEERLVLAAVDRLKALGYLARSGMNYGVTATGDAALKFGFRTYENLVNRAAFLGVS